MSLDEIANEHWSMNPLASVVIPVYNAEQYLAESLDSILNQTLTNIEVICVNDESTDTSARILETYAHFDPRIIILNQPHRGAGAARNLGLKHVRGIYTYFFDADDNCNKILLEETVKRAEETSADIVAFEYFCCYEDGTEKKVSGIHDNWLADNVDVFNYRDCPNRIMTIINPAPWNKIFRTQFLTANHLQYDEISSTNDISFLAVSLACAERISFIKKPLFYYHCRNKNSITSTKSVHLDNVIKAVQSAIEQVKRLPYYEMIKKSSLLFAIDNLIYAFEHYVDDFESIPCQEFYQFMHSYFCTPDYLMLESNNFYNPKVYRSFLAIQQYDYNAMKDLLSK